MRARLDTGDLVSYIALFSVTLIRLPVLVGHPRLLQPLVVGGFMLCIAWAIPRVIGRPSGTSRAGTLLAFAFAASVAVALLRGAHAGVYNSKSSALIEGALYLALVGFGLLLITSSRDASERTRRLIFLALAPAVYVALNLLLYLGGKQSPITSIADQSAYGKPAEMLALLGIGATRVRFALATSVNLFGVIASVGLVTCVVLWLRVRDFPRWVTAAGAAACAVCVLLVDSRGPLAVALAVILYFALSRRARGTSALAYVLPLLPVLVVAGLSMLDSFGVSDLLGRNGTDFATGTGRTYIWQASWDLLSHPHLQHLIGWGVNGHTTSLASLHWAWLFRGVVEDPTTAPTHSLVLQTIFDMGYIGLALLIAAVALAIRSLVRAVDSPAVALLAALVVILLCGATEISTSPYAQESLAMLLMILGAAAGLGLPERDDGGRVSDQVARERRWQVDRAPGLLAR